MEENKDVAKKRPLLRKRFWLTPLIIVSFSSLLFIPVPNFHFPPEKISQGEYFEKFLQEKDNGFHGLMYAARIQKDFEVGARDSDSMNELYEKFSDLCLVDVAKEPLDPAIIKLVDDNQFTFQVIDQAVSNKITVPKCDSMEARLPYLATFRQLARLKIADAKVKESLGDINGAYEDYYEIFKMAHGTANGGPVIHGLVGIAMDTMALRAMKPTIPQLNECQLIELIKVLQEADNNAVKFLDVMKTESGILKEVSKYANNRGFIADVLGIFRVDTKDIVANFPRNVIVNLYWTYLQINKPKFNRTLSEFWTEAERFAAADYGSQTEAEIADHLFGPDGPIVNNFMLAVHAPSWLNAKDAFKRNATIFRGTTLVAAKQLYQIRCGDLVDLNELVSSGILSQIPIDPFSGQPFKYVDGKIYSFGHDKDDDLAAINVFDEANINNQSLMNNGDMIFQ